MRILGIDPGSRITGFGVVDLKGNRLRHVAHGALRLSSSKDCSLDLRLKSLHEQLSAVLEKYRPDVVAVEKVFFAKNAVSALKLGQARGAAILVCSVYGLKFFEYNPTEIKRAVVGHGRADKAQVAKMVSVLLGQQDFETEDASDALAIAVCHAHSGAGQNTDSVLRQQKTSKRRSLEQAVSHRIKSID